MWLALGLSVATTMVVVAHATSRTPPAASSSQGAHSVTAPVTTPKTGADQLPKLGAKPKASTKNNPGTDRSTTNAVAETPSTTVETSLPPATDPSLGRPIETAIAPSPVSEQWSGVMGYPDDVATSYSFITTGGDVAVHTVLARGAAALSATLACGESQVAGRDVTQLTMHASPGTCTYDLQFLPKSFRPRATASYEITAQYLATTPSS